MAAALASKIVFATKRNPNGLPMLFLEKFQALIFWEVGGVESTVVAEETSRRKRVYFIVVC
ncbi:hypothetical protein H072_10546 [Dactylellina haptotyla CBS 200.50]|uniref:Uncharacterized protein n=1 Tax=Dactylellina haptotyla (strain CBS 200.50) TaxID=1284197 RepID=S8BL62_DACHA|nr:hypothetical protein H072_10546 [Dactylellina haptotyla CBS 200.50]